jgi:tetratricopeptide (TPR) repeat protein/Txe/YoeB family toxin of Txe-Axe toxin-antitoxin module
MSLPAVLHPDVVDFLRTNKEEYLKASVWECIDKLKQQQFDGGLRVKKLKGIVKKVWEARVTKAIRLIFTYDKSRQPETGKAQVYIAVQDICLDHDDVSRRAARNKTPDSEWLNAELIEEIGSLENDFLTSEEQLAIKEAQTEEWQINSDFTDELLGNIQWRVIDSESEWQRAIIQQDADLLLKLTPEEYELVNLYGSLLLSGSAGTGKTTVGLYRLLKSLETLPDGKRLYVAYNPILLKEAQKQFKRLMNGSNAEIESIFHFKTIRDLCLDILSLTGQNYFPEDEVTYQIFEQLYRRQSYKDYPPALVWDEIRSIIKGAHLETSSYQLSQKQYEQLGKKRSSVIPQKDRYKAYKVAEWYQGLLKKEGRFDEIDLARKVLQLIWQGKGDRYQLIVCDEVQDFSELQLELLVRLVTPGGQLFFAGDLHQMISPSGFRWEDLKTKFFKGQREAIQKTLNFNFRSVGSLVNLANQILKLRYRLLQERISDFGQPSSSYGECARLISAPLETLQPTLGQLNPDDAILVRTDADKQRFSQEFQSNFVFTIEEAKGLEFDTIFLVEFFKPRQSLWNKVLNSKPSLNKTDEPELRLELNLLYVAVTRARRILNIWETKLSDVWSQSELVSFLQLINPELVRKNRVEPTEEMWRKRGFYYLECGFYRQASECFEKSGDIELHWQTMAKLLLQERKYSEAAQLFVDLQNWQQAAELFEKANQWKEAANCWVKTGNSERQKLCEVKAFETAELWEDAARFWEEIGRFEDAKRCWLKSDNEQKKAEIRAVEFEQKKQWSKATEQYELAGMREKAEECRAKNQPINNADYYIKRGIKKARQGDVNGHIHDWELALQVDTSYVEGLKISEVAYEKEHKDLSWMEENKEITLLNVARFVKFYYQQLGLTLANQRNYHGAIKYFTKVLQIDPNDAQAYCNRGQTLARMEDKQGAIEDYNKALQINLNYALAYKNRGVTRREMGDYQGAIEDYNKALQINPSDDEAYYNRGNVLVLELKDYQGAIADYSESLRINPKNALAYFNRGNAHLFVRNYQKAIADFKQTLKVDPHFAEAKENLSLALAAIENNQEEITDTNQSLQDTLAAVYDNRGVLCSKQGDYQRAISNYNQALQINPINPIAYYNRGNARFQLGDAQGAIADYDQAIKLNPNDAGSYLNRGIVRAELGDIQRAIVDYTQALQINPNFAAGYNNRGIARMKLEDIQGAIADYNEALRLNPKLVDAYLNRGTAHFDIGNYGEAIRDESQALSLNPNDADAYYNRGNAYRKLGDFAKALKDFQKAAELYLQRGKIDDYQDAIRMIKNLN